MQKESTQSLVPGAFTFFLDIERVADNGMIVGQHMDSDLVGATGMDFNSEEGKIGKIVFNHKFRKRGFALIGQVTLFKFRDSGHPVGVAGARDREIDDSFFACDFAVDQYEVFLIDSAVFKLLFKMIEHVWCSSNNQEPRSFFVKAVNNARPIRTIAN